MSEAIPKTEVQLLTENMIEEDHREALRIHHMYYINLADDSPDSLTQPGPLDVGTLELAFGQYEQTPALEFHGAEDEDIGYAMAKNAWRWWQYTDAYIKDLEAGVSGQTVTGTELSIYKSVREMSREKLSLHDEMTFRTYDLLEKERLLRQRDHKPELTPFEAQEQYAFLVLTKTIDVAALEIGYDSTEDLDSYHALSPDESADYLIRREMGELATTYTIKLDIMLPPVSTTPVDSIFYTLSEDDRRHLTAVAAVNNDRELVHSSIILELAADLVTDPDEVFERVESALQDRVT